MKVHRCAIPWLLAAALLGCRAEPGVQLAPVRGQAVLGDKGLARVTIQLIPDEKKGTSAPTGVGQTDDEGRFQITTPPHGEGAVPGTYKVTVTSYGGDVPRRYTDPKSSPLSVEIPSAGLADWRLEISSK